MASGGGTALLDFGPATAPSTDAVCVVTGQTGLTLTGQVEAWIRADDTNDHSVDELRAAGPRVLAKVTAVGEVTIYATAASGADYGAYVVDFVWYDRGAGLTWPAVSAYYSSPGGAGDYAEADSVVAARVVFPGAAQQDPWTIAFWFTRPTTNTNSVLVECTNPGGAQVQFRVDLSSPDSDNWLATSLVGNSGAYLSDAYPDLAANKRMTWTFDGTTVRHYQNGALVSSGTSDTPPFEWAESATNFRLLAEVGGGLSCDGIIRNVLINDRAHTALEEADLYAAGPTHHPLNAAGTHWAAGESIPVIWCTPAVNGSVANSGDGGPCRLSLRGSITSEEDA